MINLTLPFGTTDMKSMGNALTKKQEKAIRNLERVFPGQAVIFNANISLKPCGREGWDFEGDDFVLINNDLNLGGNSISIYPRYK